MAHRQYRSDDRGVSESISDTPSHRGMTRTDHILMNVATNHQSLTILVLLLFIFGCIGAMLMGLGFLVMR